MTYEEITPHLNKMSKLDLKNKKRKMGWLYIDNYHQVSEEPLKEVHYINIKDRKKLDLRNSEIDMKSVERYSQVIQLSDIQRVRSPLE